jgi:hypothetical protein
MFGVPGVAEGVDRRVRHGLDEVGRWRAELPQRFQVRFRGRGIAAVAGDHGGEFLVRR